MQPVDDPEGGSPRVCGEDPGGLPGTDLSVGHPRVCGERY